MSIIVIDNEMVHYEVFGRGRPVLFLHGWHGSWRYWFPTIEGVARHFRTYSFDFWGFGDSRSAHRQESIQSYSQQVVRFLDKLGIDRVALVGHSMGGMVALKTALDYPERVIQVTTVGAPFQGKSLSLLLKLANYGFITNSFARWSWIRRTMFNFFMGDTRDPAVQEIIDDSLKSSASTLQYAVRSMLRTDLQPELKKLHVPALIVHGKRDDVVDPRQVNLFRSIAAAEVVLMPNSRHFPFLDEAEAFNTILLHFLKQGAPPNNFSERPPPPTTTSQQQHASAPARSVHEYVVSRNGHRNGNTCQRLPDHGS